MAEVAGHWLQRLVPNSQVRITHMSCTERPKGGEASRSKAEGRVTQLAKWKTDCQPEGLLFGLHLLSSLSSRSQERLCRVVRSCRALGASATSEVHLTDLQRPGHPTSGLLPGVNMLGQCKEWRAQDPHMPFQQFFIALGQERQRTWAMVLGMQDLDTALASSLRESSRSRSRSRGGQTHCSRLTSPSEEEGGLEEDRQTVENK